MKRIGAVVCVLMAATPAVAHRLDEYLQGAYISVAKDRVEVQMTLTPGVAVLPILMAHLDPDGDGALSREEQAAYAGKVLREVELTADGARLMPRLIRSRFPAVAEMRAGRGEIRISFDAALPAGGPNRILGFENHHLRQVSAYQVNSLVPRDPDIQISRQERDYLQTSYRLEYRRTDVSNAAAWLAPGRVKWLWMMLIGLALAARVAFLARGHARLRLLRAQH